MRICCLRFAGETPQNNTKKGDTKIRKSSDAYLSTSHAGPKPILFIGRRGVA